MLFDGVAQVKPRGSTVQCCVRKLRVLFEGVLQVKPRDSPNIV